MFFFYYNSFDYETVIFHNDFECFEKQISWNLYQIWCSEGIMNDCVFVCVMIVFLFVWWTVLCLCNDCVCNFKSVINHGCIQNSEFIYECDVKYPVNLITFVFSDLFTMWIPDNLNFIMSYQTHSHSFLHLEISLSFFFYHRNDCFSIWHINFKSVFLENTKVTKFTGYFTPPSYHRNKNHTHTPHRELDLDLKLE